MFFMSLSFRVEVGDGDDDINGEELGFGNW